MTAASQRFEYTLITVILAVVVMFGVDTIGTALSTAFGAVGTALSVQASGI